MEHAVEASYLERSAVIGLEGRSANGNMSFQQEMNGSRLPLEVQGRSSGQTILSSLDSGQQILAESTRNPTTDDSLVRGKGDSGR